MNMPYVNVSLDVGAAMNAYLLTWNEPESFKNVIIHLGSFHFLKENFQVSLFSSDFLFFKCYDGLTPEVLHIL